MAKVKPTLGMAGTVEIEARWYYQKFNTYGEFLLNTASIYEVHLDFNNLNECLVQNEPLLQSVSKRDIVYCLWQSNNEDAFEPAYLGQAKANGARARIRSHLFKQTGTTKCKLDKVKASVINGKRIGISYIEINPAFFRAAIEEYLINKHSAILPWNEVGTNNE